MYPIAEEGRNVTGPCKKMCDSSVRGLVVTYNGPYSLVVTYSGPYSLVVTYNGPYSLVVTYSVPYTRRYFRHSALSLEIGQA